MFWLTVAVRVTVWPKVAWLGDGVREVLVAMAVSMVWTNAMELVPLKFVSPG